MFEVCVPPDRVAELWPLAQHYIKSAVVNTLTDFDTLARNVHAGDALLWLAWDGKEIYAAAVTSLASANGRKFCTIVACGGQHIEQWGFLIGRLEQYAKDEGCKSNAIMGRKGWARMLPEYRVTSITLEKEL